VMDRNSIIGLLLIGAILLGYSYYMQPTEEQIAAARAAAQQDSVAAAQINEVKAKADAETTTIADAGQGLSAEDSMLLAKADSLKQVQSLQRFGELVKTTSGEAEFHVIENDFVKFTTSSKGGAPVQAELKDYVTSDTMPLYLFDKETSSFGFKFWLNKGTEINTNELYWEPVASEMSNTRAVYRLYKLGRTEYIQMAYELNEEKPHLVDAQISVVGFDNMLREMDDYLEMNWNIMAPVHEKSREQEKEKTTVYYRLNEEDADYISERNYEKLDFETSIQWVSFKQQYFSAALISEGFSKENAFAETIETEDPRYLKGMTANLGLELKGAGEPSAAFQFYVGPNHYQTLSDLEIGLEDQIDLGWPIISWVNTLIVIPVFNFLDEYTGLSYGIIILLLTLFIKSILFPLTWKNYVSSARMKVLKPEIEEINNKFGDKDPMQKQQAVMGLYRQAGVNPMAGCIPMILQMPILYAMFRFFPASIELRQEGFLWATDLSTYDSIFNLPFEIPFYGDHVSLFTILMAISTFLYSKYNMDLSGGMAGNAQMSQMKIMIYFMPVMLLVFFNNYAAGLSYYYFTANIISVGQQFVIKKFFINEEKIHAKIQANKAKPNKKSGFQKRLEDMAKQRGVQTKK
jgi:YidC/Oxa1 family membrane protein insertase